MDRLDSGKYPRTLKRIAGIFTLTTVLTITACAGPSGEQGTGEDTTTSQTQTAPPNDTVAATQAPATTDPATATTTEPTTTAESQAKPATTPETQGEPTATTATSPASKEGAEDVTRYTVGEISVALPEAWNQLKENENRRRFFFPGGALAVATNPKVGSIKTKAEQKEYLELFEKGVKDYKLESLKDIEVMGEKGFQHVSYATIEGRELKIKETVFTIGDDYYAIQCNVDARVSEFPKEYDQIIDSIMAASSVKEKPNPAKVQARKDKALQKAQSYVMLYYLSKEGLKHQLDLEGFNKAEIDYVLDKLKVDWRQNALKAGKQYKKEKKYNKAQLKKQLDYEGFSKEQISYVLSQLFK